MERRDGCRGEEEEEEEKEEKRERRDEQVKDKHPASKKNTREERRVEGNSDILSSYEASLCGG